MPFQEKPIEIKPFGAPEREKFEELEHISTEEDISRIKKSINQIIDASSLLKENVDQAGEKIESLENISTLDLNELRILKKDGLKITISISVRIPGTSAATAGNYSALFFIAKRTYELISITERHEVKGSDAGAATVMLKRVPDATAPASGTDMLTAGINLKATANTNQTGTIVDAIANKRLVDGEALSLVTTGTLTAVAGVTVTVELKSL